MNNQFRPTKSTISKSSRFGLKYFIRLIALLAVTAALTWYARQDRNNPFAAEKHVIVAGDSSCSYIHFFTRNSSTSKQTVVLTSLCGKNSERWNNLDVTSWLLVSLDIPGNMYSPGGRIPAEWYIVDKEKHYSDSAISLPSSWPRPETLNNNINIGDTHISNVKLFDSDISMLIAHHGKISAAIISNMSFQKDSVVDSEYKEFFDIIIALNIPRSKLPHLRRIFRPIYLISLPPVPDTASVSRKCMQNILFPSPEGFSFDFSKNVRNHLRLE